MVSSQDGGAPPAQTRPKQRNMPTKKEKQDVSIMETNNSCIVSKRSVERIYHKEDDGFLRYFVKKFQRRSPLINRGYWLRMRAIEHVVKTFLEETEGKKRTVVNLGCGYDPLPFNFLFKHSGLCKDATFVDVDYKQLMQKKCEIVRTTNQLSSIIGFTESAGSNPIDGVLIDCSSYKAVACDLEDATGVSRVLKDKLELAQYPILFLAEVSITYMDAVAAEKLIDWTSTFSDARFAVLEQYLPDGEQHPFAITMLNHFNKLNSPLKTAIRNPSAEDQKKRFTRGNWKDIDFRSLWSLWSDDDFLPPDERQALDQVEPFDEWEEFQLFCSHYFLLIARNIKATKPSCDAIDTANMDQLAPSLTSRYRLSRGESRRFGASSHADSQIWTTGGYGLQSRLDSTELLHPCGDLELTYPPHYVGISTLPVALMCHTTTIVEKGLLLLVGGRSSPSSPSAACYLWHGKTWSQVEALPFGLYRHTAVSVRLPTRSGDTPQHGVLVFGGKTGPSRINDKWLLWTETDGWTMLECSGSPSPPEPRFGAAMARSLGSWMQSSYLTGGIGSRGVILQDLWDVRLCRNDQDRLVVFCQDMTCGISSTAASPSMLLSNLGRFGASLVPYTTSLEEYQQFLLIGGVVRENVLVQGLEVLQLNIMGHDLVDVQRMDVDWSVRPMLIGSSVEFVDEATIVVAYGGAVCFSFGTYWNDGVWTLSGRKTPTAWNVVKKQESATNEASSKSLNVLPLHLLSRSDHDAVVAETQGSTLDLTGSATDFDTIMNAGQPLILSGLHLGPCLQTWTLEHLKQNIGCDRKVVVHAAASPTMNFLAKDFDYATIPFGDFVDKVASGERLYMRAISKDTNTPTSLKEDFPTIAQDFQIPTELAYITANMHSSVLRMSGPVNMWLHFDVQANIYCQIQGEKRLILFPPTDVQYLDFPAGASSSRLNIFDADGHAHYPAHTQPIIFDISPGDVLYIPPLWLHSAKPTSGTSIAVNVFFRSLQSGYAAGKDVYGNRDLQAYENGRRDVGKITKAFKGLPEDVRKFYLSRLAGEILEAAV